MRFKLKHYRNLIGDDPRTVLEAGVGSANTCRTYTYFQSGIDCLLFEPSLKLFCNISIAASEFPKAKIHWAALHDTFGVTDFVDMGNGGSFLKEVVPRSTKEKVLNKKANLIVPTVCISHYDTGDIDLALLDMEGTEWYALKHLVSRPKVIIIEVIWESNKEYKHPYYDEIMLWMKENGYVEYARDDCDIMFIKK